MRLIWLRLRVAWLIVKESHAADILAYREADYLEAKAIYNARAENLRRLRAHLATHESPDVILRDIVRP